MKPVIVQVVQHLRPGGIEVMSLDLLYKMRMKADVYIFSLEGDLESALKEWPRLDEYKQHLRFFNKQPGISFKLILKLKSALNEVNASAVHTHHIGPLMYGGFAAKLLHLTHVHTEHDTWHLNANSNRKLQKKLMQLFRPIVVADCEAVASRLIKEFPFIKPKVILNGIDTQHFVPPSVRQKLICRKELNLPKHSFLIGCAARLETVKGHELLLKALHHSSQDISLVLAGSGSLRRHLEKTAERLRIADRVFFLGHLDDTLPFYQAIDLFCLPSLNEGLPLSPLEAQACGVPTIVTDVGGCKDVVCPTASTVIKPRSIQALIIAIVSQHYFKSSTNPRDFVLRTGNLTKTADSYLNLLTESVEA